MEKKKTKIAITTLPKGAIIGILLILPCLGFLFGMQYQKYIDGKVSLYPVTPVQPMPPTAISSTPVQINNSCQIDTDCVLYNPQKANNSSLCCHNQNMLCTKDTNQIIAINKSFYDQQVKTVCKAKTVCPMYMMMCPADIQQSINQLKAKCIQNICQIAHNP